MRCKPKKEELKREKGEIAYDTTEKQRGKQKRREKKRNTKRPRNKERSTVCGAIHRR